MADVVVAPAAVGDLEALIRTHHLPPDTKDRVRGCLRSVGTFPDSGRNLWGLWELFQCLGGPWPWMLIVYEHLVDDDLVIVVTIQDARSSTAATGEP